MLKAIEVRAGRTILLEGNLYIVHEIHHVAKGNKGSYMSAKLKNFRTGSMSDHRFNVNDRIEVPFVETREYEYLFKEADSFVLMDLQNYDQINVTKDIVGDAANYLKSNERVTCEIYNGEIVGFAMPNVVELVIKETPPVVKGSTVTNQPKDAIMETGVKVRVPAFIESGEKIRVDTRTGEYIERAR